MIKKIPNPKKKLVDLVEQTLLFWNGRLGLLGFGVMKSTLEALEVHLSTMKKNK